MVFYVRSISFIPHILKPDAYLGIYNNNKDSYYTFSRIFMYAFGFNGPGRARNALASITFEIIYIKTKYEVKLKDISCLKEFGEK
jgi:hypothetical protein